MPQNDGNNNEEARWYVAHTYSGYENKVKDTLEKAVENRSMQDVIQEIVVPMEEQIEIKDGKLTASFAADEAERIITFFYKTADGSENSATVKLPSGKAGSIQVLSMPWNDRIIEAAWQIGQSPKQPLFLP